MREVYSRWYAGQENWQDARRIRMEVFVLEQGFSAREEFDTVDAQAKHVVLYVDQKPVAAARIFQDGQGIHLGRICVLAAYRGHALGARLMRELLQQAKRMQGDAKVDLIVSAQEQAAAFYARFGFKAVGEPYYEEHVKHIRMIGRL